MNRSYLDLIKLQSFEERYEYLKLGGRVGVVTFGYDRHLNQVLYRSQHWKSLRDRIIIRDRGCDLGVDGWEIQTKLMIHHINPISKSDILTMSASLFDESNLITTSHKTHLAIHYGDASLIPRPFIPRSPGDTKLW